MPGSTAFVQTIGPGGSRSATCHQSSTSSSANAQMCAMPALLTSRSIGRGAPRPASPRARPGRRRRRLPTMTSHAAPRELPPAAAVSARPDSDRATRASAEPASARITANSRPRPRLAPVTIDHGAFQRAVVDSHGPTSPRRRAAQPRASMLSRPDASVPRDCGARPSRWRRRRRGRSAGAAGSLPSCSWPPCSRRSSSTGTASRSPPSDVCLGPAAGRAVHHRGRHRRWRRRAPALAG